MNQDKVIDNGIEYIFVEDKRNFITDCSACDLDELKPIPCRLNKNFKCISSTRDDEKDGYFKKVERCTE